MTILASIEKCGLPAGLDNPSPAILIVVVLEYQPILGYHAGAGYER